MAIGSKAKYTAAQKRKARHIEESYEQKGISPEKAAEIAWATVNKQSGGGERSGSGTHTSAREKKAARKDSAKNAVATRKEKASSNSLESHTKEYLLQRARALHIAGRSSMNKPELILALRREASTS
ncbi:MAG: termination factor Rho [Cellvibrio sp.]|uniref:termination factor Rho n=1 Tax=Cellvibrio sp. TaxID=1965322 RepID=UPI0031AE148E